MSQARRIIHVNVGDATHSERVAKLLAEQMRVAYPEATGVRSEGTEVLADARLDLVVELRAFANGFVFAVEAMQ